MPNYKVEEYHVVIDGLKLTDSPKLVNEISDYLKDNFYEDYKIGNVGEFVKVRGLENKKEAENVEVNIRSIISDFYKNHS